MNLPNNLLENLNKIVVELKSSRRNRAAKELREFVNTVSRELAGEIFTKFMNDVNRRIFELVHSNETNEKIESLIDFEEDNTTKITRYANYLRIVLPGNDPLIMGLAAKALGKLAVPNTGGTLTGEFVEYEVNRSLEWLQGERIEQRRHAAVLILSELAANSPTLIYTYIPQILDLIWTALRDAKPSIRESAAQALDVCLVLVHQRENAMQNTWYEKLILETQKGFKIGTAEAIHGSLLVWRTLLKNTGNLLLNRFSEICVTSLKYKDHRDSFVRRSVIELMSDLALFDPSSFTMSYLNKWMHFLLQLLKKDREKSVTFLAIGKIATAIESNITPFIDPIFANIKEGLSVKSRSKFIETEAAIFSCLQMLSESLGEGLTKYVHTILDLLFAIDLCDNLHLALRSICEFVTPVRDAVQKRLLDIICYQLFKAPYQHPGKPQSPFETKELNTGMDEKESEACVMALKILGQFDFRNVLFKGIIKQIAEIYLDNDIAEVRMAAAMTCSSLLVNDPMFEEKTMNSQKIVTLAIEKMLIVAIADPNAEVRMTVMKLFDEHYDVHLSQAENIRSLFIALNDEVFAIREIAITIIGRIAIINPAYVMPSLRKTLIQLLTELEYSAISRNKEESARLLGILIHASNKLVKPYVEPIFTVLIPKLKDPSSGVASSILSAVGALALSGGEDMLPFIDKLFHHVMESLNDQSSISKREAALRTIRQIATGTSYVIEPWFKYHGLMEALINILKTEQSPALRQEAVKVIGVLGAVDPYRFKVSQTNMLKQKSKVTSGIEESGEEIRPSSEEYYPMTAISSLMKILRDPSLAIHHTAVIQAVMYIFKTLGLKCISFLPQILPAFFNIMGNAPAGILEFHFQQLGILVSIVNQHIRGYLPSLLNIIQEHWNPNSNLQMTILALVEAIARALDTEFKIYLPSILPHMLRIFELDPNEKYLLMQRALQVLVIFGTNLEEYLHLTIPVIAGLFEREDAPLTLKKAAIQAVTQLCRRINFADNASRIIHPLLRVLNTLPELRRSAMDCLSCLVYQMSSEYLIFVPTVNKTLLRQKIHHSAYDELVSKLLKNEPFLFENIPKIEESDEMKSMDSMNIDSNISISKLPVNQQNLKKAWETSQRSTREDWLEWLRRFSVELLKESPSHALRACASLANVYYPLARELFNSAFLSCWVELYDQFQDELVRSLESALTSSSCPAEIVQTILNLAEFLEHDDKPLPIDVKMLGIYANKCHAFAKALHYKESEYLNNMRPSTIESLISINNQLQQPDAAIGILKHAQKKHDIELKESWYEKLQRWDDALLAYKKRQVVDPNSFEATLGIMRCRLALGDWDQLSTLAKEKWQDSNAEMKQMIAPIAAASAWGMGEWELMENYIDAIKTNSPDGAFFRAILAIHRNLYRQTEKYINQTRELLDTELTALVGESYNRAYNIVVRVQMLTELEEIVVYKQSYDDPQKQSLIKQTWNKRLEGCQRNVEVWQRILRVRSLVIPPCEDMEVWIKFANLCRKSGKFHIGASVLKELLKIPKEKKIDVTNLDFQRSSYPATFAFLKLSWEIGDRYDTFQSMTKFTKVLLLSSQSNDSYKLQAKKEVEEGDCSALLSKCFRKLGDWQKEDTEKINDVAIPQILDSYSSATKHDADSYKAWHSWALTNFEVVSYFEEKSDPSFKSRLTSYLIAAVQGFFKSISLSKGNSLQDTLRLLTLWFKYGAQQDVNMAINDGFSNVSVDTWLQVIPQIIARIHAPSPHVRRLIHGLLSDIGKEHPQALIYSLTVASKSQSNSRKASAVSILDKMRVYYPLLVEQVLLVSEELIRVAILWHEIWHEGLEEASRLYFGEKDVDGMLNVLEPLHNLLERGPETLREVAFNQAFGRDLQEARDWTKKFRKGGNANDLNQAWELYYHVFKKINKQLPQLTRLELQFVSPKLLAAKNLELAVPGSYRVGEDVVTISEFNSTLNIITSKQRPRKITVIGSNGIDYQYLLKGHEDLRQDERVMQLFGLVNTLLSNDAETFKRHLTIQRFPVIPLSPNSGLIGWLPHCDTLHSLIKEYRESRNVMLSVEHRMMLQMAPDYDNLTHLQKIEVFEHAAHSTTGQDLYNVLWLKSTNSEAWLERRTTYTRSLAVMSIVGYVLGLGDRHPSNLMIERSTGRVIHIDFGDCFEVAMHRDKFPERIPFRLTRMLINAMEVSGIEGNYRTTCEHVMRVLRQNKDSLMAVLEAFIHDPLINWRLLNDDRKRKEIEEDLPVKFPLNRKAATINDASSLEEEGKPEFLNTKALSVIHRISNKLTGKDFGEAQLDVESQVQKLIEEATSNENLCECYIGWCPFW